MKAADAQRLAHQATQRRIRDEVRRAVDARRLADQAVERRRNAEEQAANAARTEAEAAAKYKGAVTKVERALEQLRMSATAAAMQSIPLVAVETAEAKNLSTAICEANTLAEARGYPLVKLPAALHRLGPDDQIGSCRGDWLLKQFSEARSQLKNRQKLEYLDRVSKRRAYIHAAVIDLAVDEPETFDDFYILDVQRTLESGASIPDAILDECAKKAQLRLPDALKVENSLNLLLEDASTVNLDLMIKLLIGSGTAQSFALLWRNDVIEPHWTIAANYKRLDAPHVLLDQANYNAPTRSADCLSNPDLLTWLARKGSIAFRNVLNVISSAAEAEAYEIECALSERSARNRSSPQRTFFENVSLLRLQTLGLPIDDSGEVIFLFCSVFRSLGYRVEKLPQFSDERYSVSWKV